MSPEEIASFLDTRPGWAVLCTVLSDGTPHAVPLGYFMQGADMVLGAMEGTQKVVNVARNPRVSVLVEHSEGSELQGVMLVGTATLVRDDDERLHLGREAARQRGLPEAEWPQQARPGGVYIRVHPNRHITWHYR